jgi:hypothetical protein
MKTSKIMNIRNIELNEPNDGRIRRERDWLKSPPKPAHKKRRHFVIVAGGRGSV